MRAYEHHGQAKTYSKDKRVERSRANIKQFRVFAKSKSRRLKLVRGQEQTQQGDESICCDGWSSTSRHQRRESDLARQDRAEKGCGKNEDDSDRIAWLPLRVDPSNPSRQRKHTITSDGEHQARRRDDCYRGVLWDPKISENARTRKSFHTIMRPRTAIIVMKILAFFPRASA